MTPPRILDGRALYGGLSFQAFILSQPHRALMLRRGLKIPRLDDIDGGPSLPAWIQQSYLVVSCPECTASGRPDAEVAAVWLEGPHLMYCAVCGNAAVGGRMRRVALPDRLNEIDALLGVRENPGLRNWIPGESVENLVVENAALGLVTLEVGAAP